jgi:uncharacterized protein DUF6666
MSEAKLCTRVLIVTLASGICLANASRLYASDEPPPPGVPAAVAGQAPGVFDTLSLFVGPDGSKQPQDLGINANMGIRVSANWGAPLSKRLKLGLQLGVGANISNNAVHVLDQIQGTTRRTQTFLTAGLFQRATDNFNWGLVYDTVLEHYYDDFHLSQLRGQAGYNVTRDNEIGASFTKRLMGQDGVMGTTAVRLDPIDQIKAYTRHTWATRAQTTVWLGVANGHNDVVWVFPDNSRDTHVLLYGAELYLPLSEKFAVTGAANLLTPASTGTVDAYLGVTYFFGHGAFRATGSTFAPLQSVANNPEMAVNLHR